MPSQPAVKLSPSGKSGWAAALVVQREGAGKKQRVYPTFRFLWTVAEEGGVWNIVSEHQSLAVNSELRDPATPDALKAWAAAREELNKLRTVEKQTTPKREEKPAEPVKKKEEKPADQPMRAW